ncbi:MAG: SpoIIE family protein phosphatase, partial [Bacteroidales bacterium]|nr:SpoIIE family protein phosphatase [Bacteroidales bacterium]
CIYNKKKKEIEFSGAYNPLYLVRGGEFFEYKGDRMPIGYYPKKVNFTTQIIKVKKGDMLYLFSDGYPDQFGGPKNKKFTAKRFKQILINDASKTSQSQHISLQKQLDAWQTESEQIDDILVIGIRI